MQGDFFSLCTKSAGCFTARPRGTWCTNPRKVLIFRCLCTKSAGCFKAWPPWIGARIHAKSCSSVAFAPSLRPFSACGRRGLGARIPAKSCSSVPFAPSLRVVSRSGRGGLGARIPARPCSFVPFAPSLRAFSHAAAGKRDLNHRLCDFCSKRSIIRVSIFPIVFNGRMNIDKF